MLRMFLIAITEGYCIDSNEARSCDLADESEASVKELPLFSNLLAEKYLV